MIAVISRCYCGVADNALPTGVFLVSLANVLTRSFLLVVSSSHELQVQGIWPSENEALIHPDVADAWVARIRAYGNKVREAINTLIDTMPFTMPIMKDSFWRMNMRSGFLM